MAQRLDTCRTADLLMHEHGGQEPEMSVALKAIAVNRGNRQVPIRNPEAMQAVAEAFIEDVKKHTKNTKCL